MRSANSKEADANANASAGLAKGAQAGRAARKKHQSAVGVFQQDENEAGRKADCRQPGLTARGESAAGPQKGVLNWLAVFTHTHT